jgi:molecular chaperone DnaK
MAQDNKMLGQFDLVGIPPAPRGIPQIEVTFDIDANGIVQVGAKDKATNKEQTIRIQASGGLSDDEIDRMVKEAEANAAEDKVRREQAEAANQADSLIQTVEKNLAEHGDALEAEDKSAIEADLQALKDAKEAGDPEDVKSKVEALTQSSMKLGEAMYKASQAEGMDPDMGQEGDNAADGDDGVVDADFEEVKDDDQKKSA